MWDRTLNTFPNGMCIGPREEHLYVVMSLNPPRVVRVNINQDGSAGDVETVVELPQTVPDGLAFDSDGNLYISCYRPDRIYRFDTEGRLDILADDFEGSSSLTASGVAASRAASPPPLWKLRRTRLSFPIGGMSPSDPPPKPSSPRTRSSV